MRQMCFVNGVHRSGTSTAAAMLFYLGFDVGKASIRSGDSDNTRGYYENFDVVHFNDRLLTSLGLRWDSLVLDGVVFKELFADRFAEAEKLLQDNFGDSNHAFLKDPRLAYSLSFWRTVLKARFPECEEKHLLIVRHPRGVVQSLIRRTDKGIVPFRYYHDSELSFAFWIYNILRFLEQVADQDVLRITYETQSTKKGRSAIFSQLSKFLNVEVPSGTAARFEREFYSNQERKGMSKKTPSSEAGAVEHDAVTLFEQIDDISQSLDSILNGEIAHKYLALIHLNCKIAMMEFIPQLKLAMLHKPEISKYMALNRAADLI